MPITLVQLSLSADSLPENCEYHISGFNFISEMLHLLNDIISFVSKLKITIITINKFLDNAETNIIKKLLQWSKTKRNLQIIRLNFECLSDWIQVLDECSNLTQIQSICFWYKSDDTSDELLPKSKKQFLKQIEIISSFTVKCNLI